MRGLPRPRELFVPWYVERGASALERATTFLSGRHNSSCASKPLRRHSQMGARRDANE